MGNKSSKIRLFRWADKHAWSRTMCNLLGERLDKRVIKAFLDNPPEYIVSDNLDWLDEIIYSVHPDLEESVHNVLQEKLFRHYHYIIGFHGCRPVNLDSYLNHGILTSCRAKLEKAAREVFGNSPKLQEVLDHLREHNGFSYEEANVDKIYFTLCREHLEEDCGHYLLYGSEHLLSVAVRLGEREALRRRGKATTFECQIPIADFPSDYLRYLAGEMLEDFFERQLDSSYVGRCSFGFPIQVSLAPENIIAVHHPTQIPNSHRYGFRED